MQCSIDSRVVEGLVTGGPQPPTVETFAAMEFMGSMSMHTQHQATSTNGPKTALIPRRRVGPIRSPCFKGTPSMTMRCLVSIELHPVSLFRGS